VRDMNMDHDTVHLRIEVNKKIKTIVIQLNPDAAPQTVANFKKLVASGFYKGLAFHRVIPNYLVQTGDPNSKNSRGKSQWGLGGPGYDLPAEIKLKHQRGSVAMARLGDAVNPSKESSGSQFYISLAPLPALDGQYTVFGQVVSGLEVLDEMATVPTDDNDIPTKRTEVYDMRLVRPEAAVAAPKPTDRKRTPPPIDEDAGAVKRAVRKFW
jgi:cyclophilin family peptidyl-prolyl cis-trans isomerase